MAAAPSPDEVKNARNSVGLSQQEAGALVYVGTRTWQKWEYGERKMHPAFWELFILKTAHQTAVEVNYPTL